MAKNIEKAKMEERAMLFAACKGNTASDEEAFMDMELIENMLEYQKWHSLQPKFTWRGNLKRKALRSLMEQNELILEGNIAERHKLGI